MTPENPHWEEFFEHLDRAVGLLGCGGDGTRRFPLNPDWPTHALSKRILYLMKRDQERPLNIDIQASVEYFEQHGGYCDCEVLLNVAK
jgi:hypothetical protein